MIAHKKPEDGRLTRLLRLGMGAFWMTEQGIRRTVGDLRLPKEATQFLVDQVERRKQEIIDVMRTEIQHAIDRMDMAKLLKELLDGHDLEVTAKIRFVKRK